jgi:mannose/fructose/N-acetylgalactosamine-specific phosphotransferase system component IIC
MKKMIAGMLVGLVVGLVAGLLAGATRAWAAIGFENIDRLQQVPRMFAAGYAAGVFDTVMQLDETVSKTASAPQVVPRFIHETATCFGRWTGDATVRDLTDWAMRRWAAQQNGLVNAASTLIGEACEP